MKFVIAHLAAALGHWDKSIQLFKRGLSTDPLNPELHGDLGYEVYLRSGDFVNAEVSLRRALEISMKAETVGLRDNGTTLVLYAMGRKAESASALEQMIQDDVGWPSGLAENFAYRGDIDKALYWLERGCAEKDPALYMIKQDKLLRNLEADPWQGVSTQAEFGGLTPAISFLKNTICQVIKTISSVINRTLLTYGSLAGWVPQLVATRFKLPI